MPSFSSLLKPSRLSLQFEKRDSVQNENKQKTDSKRGFLRRMIRRASVHPKTPPLNQRVDQSKPKSPVSSHEPMAISPSSRIDPLVSPVLNSDKPLPPPPPTKLRNSEEETPQATLQLERIIAPLSVNDLQKLFSGAPQFFVAINESEAELSNPSVEFPYNTVENPPLTDHVPIQDGAWECVTAWRQSSPFASTEAAEEPDSRRFEPRCWERPSMLSMQGLERGTFGFQAALELAAADAFQESEKDYSIQQSSEYRWKALHAKEGVRPLTDTALIEQLRNVSETYHNDLDKNERPSIELYTQLFTHILHPPSRVTDVDDPYSLMVQIEALIRVLTTRHLWFDFSKVEWRIRLGQILWGSSWELEEDFEINNTAVNEPTTQIYWLLLQVLLSCELLLRLDMVIANANSKEASTKPEAIVQFEKAATSSLRWSLLLARQWLENIIIQKPIKNTNLEEKPAAAGWLASLTGSSQAAEDTTNETISDLKYEGRHQARQVRGLVHFARSIKWPNLEILIQKVSANGVALLDGIGNSTPVATPRSVSTQRSSYFSKRPGLRRGLSSINDRISAIIHPAGWLSNSYISGLILPGESLSHFLISTLLENDTEAVARLGEEASLYGGFVYQSRSFWSTSCIVGRVLAAGKHSTECMGWISSDIVPRGVKESWVDIEVEPVDEYNPAKKEKRPRISLRAEVEQRGHTIAGADETSVLPGDFTSPSDEPLDKITSVKLQSLDLFAIDDTSPPTPTNENGSAIPEISDPPQIKVYSAMMRFTIQVGNEMLRVLNLSLSNDVYFLTAHPCQPPSMLSPSPLPSSTFQPVSDYKGFKASGHLLHKAFTYTRISLSELVSTPTSTPFSTLLNPPKSPPATYFSTQHTTSSGIPKVLIVDCTGPAVDSSPIQPADSKEELESAKQQPSMVGSDLEILGRAICSERGWNALVSRRGRSCVSCAIREAGAVGWKVILRVA